MHNMLHTLSIGILPFIDLQHLWLATDKRDFQSEINLQKWTNWGVSQLKLWHSPLVRLVRCSHIFLVVMGRGKALQSLRNPSRPFTGYVHGSSGQRLVEFRVHSVSLGGSLKCFSI